MKSRQFITIQIPTVYNGGMKKGQWPNHSERKTHLFGRKILSISRCGNVLEQQQRTQIPIPYRNQPEVKVPQKWQYLNCCPFTFSHSSILGQICTFSSFQLNTICIGVVQNSCDESRNINKLNKKLMERVC